MSRIRAPSHADSSQLIERYNADRFAKVESKALLLVDQHPDYGLGWKMLAGALQMQVKNAGASLPIVPLPALSCGRITFGCFQKLAKVGEEAVEAWGNILAAVPNARLRLGTYQLDKPAQVKQLLWRLQRYGISSKRVDAHGSATRGDCLAAYSEVDMILETFPYPGGTTICEELWMGVPTLTLAGTLCSPC